MNLKWISDTLDRMIAESNVSPRDTISGGYEVLLIAFLLLQSGKDTFSDLPVDTRHLESKAQKERKGAYARGRGGARPSIKDFPQEWLPVQPTEPRPSTSTQ